MIYEIVAGAVLGWFVMRAKELAESNRSWCDYFDRVVHAVRCAYCSVLIGDERDAHYLEKIGQHMVTCEKHPLADLWGVPMGCVAQAIEAHLMNGCDVAEGKMR